LNELWQTDFTYFKIAGWGGYYLSTVLDDYSRYIISWDLTDSMSTEDVKTPLERTIAKTGVDDVKVRHKPRLLSYNGPCYLSKDLKQYLEGKEIDHTRSRPYHPMTQGKIERYHRTMKNVVKLKTYFLPWELEHEIKAFVDYYNQQRVHESLDNMTPADVFFDRHREIQTAREMVKAMTMSRRRFKNMGLHPPDQQAIRPAVFRESIS
jgi:putative transposase